MDILQADSLKQLEEHLKDVAAPDKLDKQEDEELWFRGVPRREYTLTPSLLRCKRIIDAKPKDKDEKVRALETDLFFEFLAKARTGNGAAFDDNWDALFLMQHYRAPTRLLDWTELLHVALYFAVAYPAGEAAIPRLYVMNPYQWNKKCGYGRDLYWPRYLGYDDKEKYFSTYGEILTDDELDWEYPVALYPPQRDARISVQRGFFTIHGTDLRPLDKIQPRLIVAIDLEKRAVAETKELLERSGIDEYSLFPDLEGLTRYLRKKYRTDG